MQVKVDKSILGTEGCIFSKSITTDYVLVTTEKITGIMVNAQGETSLRFASGKWIKEEFVCRPDQVKKEKKKFMKKYGENFAEK